MANARKTIEVEMIKKWANDSLSRTDEFADSKFKAGICSAIEKILHETNNYKGFGFLELNAQINSDNYYSRFYY